MKRIFILTIAIWMLAPGMALGSYYYRCRVRHCPYAFSSENPSGLVPYNVRHCPYAFSSENPSGLVSDCWGWWPHYYPGCRYSYVYYHGCASSPHVVTGNNLGSLEEMKREHEENVRARQERIRRMKEEAEERRQARENDGKEIIHRYLRDMDADFSLNMVMMIGNKTARADFLLLGRNTIIQYCNPEIETADPWKDFHEQYLAGGGMIRVIEAANKEEILEKLRAMKTLEEEKDG